MKACSFAHIAHSWFPPDILLRCFLSYGSVSLLIEVLFNDSVVLVAAVTWWFLTLKTELGRGERLETATWKIWKQNTLRHNLRRPKVNIRLKKFRCFALTKFRNEQHDDTSLNILSREVTEYKRSKLPGSLFSGFDLTALNRCQRSNWPKLINATQTFKQEQTILWEESQN